MENKKDNIGFSFWGIVASIVGVVIGIGIFFKAEAVISETGSIMSIFAWIVGAAVVGLMLMSYIEVASSTAKTGEVGSLSTWTKKFFNIKVAKVVGLFINFIYLPSIIVMVSGISTTFIMDAAISGGSNAFNTDWKQFAFIVCMSAVFIALGFAINAYLKRGGEKVQMVGTVIKFVPSFIVIVVGFFMAITGAIGGSIPPIEDQPPAGGTSPATFVNGFFLAMPAILFSFDGFIYASNLQNEMKDKSKFPKAILTSLVIIALTYILISVMTVWIGSPDTGYSIPDILNRMFAGQTWLTSLTLAFIAISGLTGLNGFMMSSIHGFRALSQDSMINDKKGTLQKTDNNGVPRNSGYAILGAIGFWFVVMWLLEVARYFIDGSGYSWTTMIDQYVTANVIIANFFYALIIVGAIANRKTKKVEVDEYKWFLPVAWIGSMGVIFFSFFNVVMIVGNAFGLSGSDAIIGNAIISVSFIVQVLVIAGLYFANEKYNEKYGRNIVLDQAV